MLFGKPRKEKFLLITIFEGYGDLVYHTPTIRALSRVFTHLDVWCQQPEPFFNNPYIKNLKIIDKNTLLPDHNNFCRITGKHIHTKIHTVDTVSLEALNHVLRNSEKTLELYWTPEDQEYVQKLIKNHPLAGENKIEEGQFVVICPAITWPSRTLPLAFYQQLISGIQDLGYGIVLVGKDIIYPTQIDINKTLHPSHHFPGTICLYNQLTLAQLAALYSITPITINTENGNHPISCTNDYTWDMYIPTLTAPEYLLPYRQGSQQYRTAVIGNTLDYYPTSIYGETAFNDLRAMPIFIPQVEKVLDVFTSVLDKIQSGENYL